jgi:hypothetical protein
MLCLIEAFTLAGTLISRASDVLVTRERAGFVMAGAVFVNLSAMALISCAHHGRSTTDCCDSQAGPGRPTADPDVGPTQVRFRPANDERNTSEDSPAMIFFSFRTVGPAPIFLPYLSFRTLR